MGGNGSTVNGVGSAAGIYVQTNDAAGNQVIAFQRAVEGTLSLLGVYDTGGAGTGVPHLASQCSVVLSDDGRLLLVANAGSDDVSVFAVEEGGLLLADRAASRGSAPTSVAVHGDLAYVLNTGGANGEPSIAGFRIGSDGRLAPLPGSTRPLSRPGADPAQASFSPDGKTLVVTERGADSISTYAVDENGYAEGPAAHPSSGATPYGFDFTTSGALIVTEAAGGQVGQASASSYSIAAGSVLSPVSGKVGNTRSEVCWAAVSKDDRFVMPYQYGSPENPRAHEETTAEEIIADCPEVDAFVAGLGTGGTLMGVGRRLRRHNPGSVGGVPATVAGLAAG